MKTPARTLFLAAFASCLTLAVAALAQDKSAPVTPDTAEVSKPAPAPAPQPANTAQAAEEAAPAPTDTSKLRRLDQPAAESAAPADATTADKADEQAAAEPTQTAAPASPEAPAAPEHAQKSKREQRAHDRFNRQSGNERVSIWQDSQLAEGEQARAVVSVFGSSTSAGTVDDAVVSVMGSSTSSGEVGQAVVSILGSSRVPSGSVGDAVVSVLGNTYVNAKVHGQVVAVLGNVELGPDAEVNGELVCIGGKVIRDPAAVVHGQTNHISFGIDFGGFEWLHAWITKCLLFGRPLAFSADVLWAWWLALGFLALYLVFALLFPGGITKCAETLEQRPGYSILTAFLTTLLVPAATILLAVTVVGAPALVVCMMVVGLFGKAAMLAWMGRRITKLFGDGPLAHPVFAVAIGGVILLLLYTIPIVGFIVAKLTSWLGVGIVVYTLILAMKRNKAAARPAVAAGIVPPGATPPPMGVAAQPAGMASAGFTGMAPSGAGLAAPLAEAPAYLSATTQPRAGFWIRIAASLIDIAIVVVVVNLFPDGWEPNLLLTFMAYCIVLWATKATTIGGIVCSLKVVRLDDRPLDWPTALVRGLGGFVSLIPAGLGFIWVAFDDQQQSWHDKIAGTTIIRASKSVPLV